MLRRELPWWVEVQLARDADKRWSWPVYLTGLRARLRCDVALVVVTPETAVAGRAAAPIATGHPISPELAVLSVMLHGHDENAAGLGEAALTVVRDLDDERAEFYTDLVLASVHEAARAILEAVMASGTYQYQSDFARRYFGRGKAEGKAEGVLAVLAARHIEVPDDVRARITACSDLALLDQWLARAATAVSLADVVHE